ncbi:hypothetical protein V8F33_009968 [Rhypophila sp. PSN 637]
MLPALSLFVLASSPSLIRAESLPTIQRQASEGPIIYNESWFGEGNFGGREGPFNVPKSQWNDLLDEPDAFDSVYIPMPNLTQPFNERNLNESRYAAVPYGSQINDVRWSLRIDLADDIPITLPNDGEDGNNNENSGGEGVTTGVRIRLQAPEEITANVDDSWQVCVMEWMLKEGTNTTVFFWMNQDNLGQCAMPVECLRDLQAYAASGPATFGRCQCPDPKAISTCKDVPFPEWSTCRSAPYSASDIRNWDNGTLDIMHYAGRPHDENDDGFGFNATAYLAWPVMVVWGLAGDAPPPDNSSSSATSSIRSLTSTQRTLPTTTGTFTLSEADPSSTSTDTVTSTLTSSDGASTPTGAGSLVNRQGGMPIGGENPPRYAAAKMACLAPRKAAEGKSEPGFPRAGTNAAGGKFAGMSFSLLVASGLAAVLALI